MVMDENYIDVIRKSLYEDSQNKVGTSQEMPRKSKKITFSVDHYNSETVFAKPKSEKLKNRKCTPGKWKKNKLTENGNSSFDDDVKLGDRGYKLKHRKPTPFKNKSPKKRKVVISFGSNESFEEDIKDDLNPSKSEVELFESTYKKPKSTKKKRNIFDESSNSEGDVAEFDLNNYFSTRDVSFNESLTDTHSGIEYEFVSEYIKDGRIVSSDLSIDQVSVEHLQQHTEYGAKVMEDVIEINESDQSEDQSDIEFVPNEYNEDIREDISIVADKLQDSMTFSDEQVETVISVGSPSLSPQLQDEEYSEGSEECNSFDYTTEYYDLEDWKLVILKKHQSMHFWGLCTLKILYGKVEVLGYVLDKQSKEINVYSPRGSALLHIKNVTETQTNERLALNNIVPNFSFDQTISDTVVRESSAVIKCVRLDDARMLFVEKHISQQIFPTVLNDNLPRVLLKVADSSNVFKECEMWDEILSNVEPSTKLLLAGGKSVGKSSFLRFAVNRLLNKFDKIRVIDLDPGQSEFAVPGCVSIVSIAEPIFGPNYTHLKATDRSLLSNINVGHNPEAYITSVKHLTEYSETLETCPTLINFMGFAQGIGLNIISSAITYIQPTDIVQIESRASHKNFKADLSTDTVQKNCYMFGSNSIPLDYKLHKVPAMNDDNYGWAVEPRQSREMCVLAYLGGMMPSGINSLTSHKLPMYEIRLSSITITNLKGETVSPAIANANLVALCSLETEPNIFRCFGYGIVRGIDLVSQSLVLLTPEMPDVLEEVYYLVIGSVILPPSVYMTPDDVRGSIPYVMKGELVSLGQITKRSYLPVNKN